MKFIVYDLWQSVVDLGSVWNNICKKGPILGNLKNFAKQKLSLEAAKYF